MKEKHDNKEIISLSDDEHVLLRPTMYVGSIEPAEEKVPIIHEGKLYIESKEISIGFYKMFHEILDNAIDEAKRMRGKMALIRVDINSETGRVTIQDTGNGFQNGAQINKTSKKSNIETAMSSLRAGSNFKNEDTDSSLIGTNGVGAAVVNILSEEFTVHSINTTTDFTMTWNKFKSDGPQIIRKGNLTDAEWKDNYKLGTTVSFIPRKKEFKKAKWDKSIILAEMVIKKFIIEHDDILNNLKFDVTFDGDKLDLNQPFFPANAFLADTKIGPIIIHESFEHSGSLSAINSAMCTGIHQRIINETINAQLGDALGHHFYETFLVFNLPPRLVRFRDQNKTRLDSTRGEIEGTIKDNLRTAFKEFFNTQLFKTLLQKVEDRKMSTEIKNLRNIKKKIDIRNSSKYFPPSSRIENLFIVEGESAMGSILQKRDTKLDGVYRLKGKIKNARSVTDLSSNVEIVELMQILDLDLEQNKRSFTYKRVIIAADADCLHEDTKILTESGVKQLKNITIHDKVFTHNNTFESVLFVNEKEYTEWIEIEIENEIFKCSPNHPWLVVRSGKVEKIPAKDLLLTDLFIKNLNSVDIYKNQRNSNDKEENNQLPYMQ